MKTWEKDAPVTSAAQGTDAEDQTLERWVHFALAVLLSLTNWINVFILTHHFAARSQF